MRALSTERQSTYGSWPVNMRGTSKQMDGMLEQYQACNPGKPLPDWWAPMYAVALKLNRIASGRYHKDNFDDLRVYLEFVETMQKGEA